MQIHILTFTIITARGVLILSGCAFGTFHTRHLAFLCLVHSLRTFFTLIALFIMKGANWTKNWEKKKRINLNRSILNLTQLRKKVIILSSAYASSDAVCLSIPILTEKKYEIINHNQWLHYHV